MQQARTIKFYDLRTVSKIKDVKTLFEFNEKSFVKL